jgi:Fe-S cluster assembly iron-binding protein IscA
MDIAKGPEQGDATIDKSGVKFFLDKGADALLSNANFDYSDIQGFIITGTSQSSCCS